MKINRNVTGWECGMTTVKCRDIYIHLRTAHPPTKKVYKIYAIKE